MAYITTQLPYISDYPKLGDTHQVFRQKADIAWNDLANFAPKANEWRSQVNAVRDEMNTFRNDTANKHSDVVSKWQDVGTKYNKVMNYIIPTNSTYDASAIDNMNNSVLTELVRQDLMIHTLAKK